MTDEEYTFRADCAEKKRVARGSANRRSHVGRGGRMKTPSDYMTKKERDKMNGEVKRYSMAHPMKWAQFKQMPDDIKREYIASIMDKFNPTQAAVAEMLGVTQRTLSSLYTALGIPSPRGCRSASGRNDAFWAWANAATTAEPTDAAEKPEGKTEQRPQGGTGTLISGTLVFSGASAQDAFAAAYALLATVSMRRVVISWEAAAEQ